jgi:hypothetical protein
MNPPRALITYRGRSLGILMVVCFQVLVGVIHVFFGFWMLLTSRTEQITPFSNRLFASDVYSVYTILFSVLTLAFTYALWRQKQVGWVGTVSITIFIIIADSLTLLDLPSVPGIPKFAGYGEITYSILLLTYLLQTHVRTKYTMQLSNTNKKGN